MSDSWSGQTFSVHGFWYYTSLFQCRLYFVAFPFLPRHLDPSEGYMLHRMSLIKQVGGFWPWFQTWIVLIGSIGLPIMELAFFRSPISAILAVLVTLLGWAFRKNILELGADYGRRSTQILFAYGVFLFLAKQFGFSAQIQLIVIALATVIMFNLNFWSISEAVIADQPADNEVG